MATSPSQQSGGQSSSEVRNSSSELREIRKAFDAGDAEESKTLHDRRRSSHDTAITVCESAEETHASMEAGEFVKSFVFGGLDGIITTFAIVAAATGANLSTNTVILMGVANLVADGLSMGMGDYLSEKAERNFVDHEFRREQWELRNYWEGEVEEMIDLYVEKKGFSREDASAVIRVFAKYPKAFVELMCVDELGFIAPDDDALPAWKKGLVTMLAFDLFGAVPVAVYVLAKVFAKGASKDLLFALSAIATALTMFALGVTKATLTKQPKTMSGLMMLLNGSLAAAAAFGIGAALESILRV
eukprot:CAMPEP_0198671452 /NCGR_PEP_ID=MMETSP1467-20131203/86220_1 /TAXON_ID=1462469 /ORGANISM="unid. sp., Strain CCMP2135" /LENGTH=301 /DNA_ID=CAMNT_0044408253 /DNA_START=5 /DNA_END=910 /DNA_ORIENTATION=+